METFKIILFGLLRIGTVVTLILWILPLIVDVIQGNFSSSDYDWGIILYSITWLVPLIITYSIVIFVANRRKLYKLDVGLLSGLIALELLLIGILFLV